MSKPTPGPWERKSIPGHLFELHNSSGDIVLRIRGGMVPTLADARLLEAAPQMLDALRKALTLIEAMADGRIAEIHGEIDEIGSIVTDAIAKAEGSK